MSFLDSLKEGAAALGDSFKKAATRFTSGPAMNRIAAVTAMMAFLPDGDADDDEIDAGIAAIHAKVGDALSISEMRALVVKHVSTLKASKRIGKVTLMDLLAPARGTDEAVFLVQVAAAVGDAPNGTPEPYTPAEKALAVEIARFLNVSPEFAE